MNTNDSRRFLIPLTLAAILGIASPVIAAQENKTSPTDSISQYDITWKFDKPVQAGQFINGDWWVVGPVTIKEVLPAWDGTCNGSVVDPPASQEQGYRVDWCNFNPRFNDSLRAKFPLEIKGTHSLVSTIGIQEPKIGGAYEGLDTAAVLTVLDKAPPADAFRPPYVAGDKPVYTASQIQWDRLPKLKVPENMELPPTSEIMKRVWLDHSAMKGAGIAPIHPVKNMEPYYHHDYSSAMALLVLLDIPERKELNYRLIQYGIDLYSISLSNGDAWRQYGGFGNGRKWPILFAGIMLNNKPMQSPPATVESEPSRTGTVEKFGEDAGTWYGKPTAEYPKGKPLWGNDSRDQEVVFKGFTEHPETASGDKDCRDPDGLLDGPIYGYRAICSSSWIGPALAARLMGAQEIWNHPAFFDYVDRWVKEETSKKDAPEGQINKRDPVTDEWEFKNPGIWSHGAAIFREFKRKMWETYRPQADKIAAGH